MYSIILVCPISLSLWKQVDKNGCFLNSSCDAFVKPVELEMKQFALQSPLDGLIKNSLWRYEKPLAVDVWCDGEFNFLVFYFR